MFFVGIDVAKHQHEAIILDVSGTQRGKAIRFANAGKGFSEFLHLLEELDEEVSVALEATGHYWLALYDFLEAQGVKVIVLNPLQVQAYRKSFLRKVKTDQRDAWMIADLLRIGRAIPSSLPPGEIRQLRELARFRFGLTDTLSDLKRRLAGVLDRVFPEYASCFPKLLGSTSKRVLSQAPTPEQLEEMELEALTELVQQASRGRWGAKNAQALHQAASSSIGVCWMVDAAKVEIQCLLAQAELLQHQLTKVDAVLTTLVESTPDGEHLLTIPGIGPTLGAVILGEIAPITRFASSSQLVAFAGIDPAVFESGQFQGTRVHLSKRGSPYLRRALWLAAHVARLHDADLKAFYHRKRAQGKPHNVVMAAVAHRLLNRIYIILKEGRPYRRK